MLEQLMRTIRQITIFVEECDLDNIPDVFLVKLGNELEEAEKTMERIKVSNHGGR